MHSLPDDTTIRPRPRLSARRRHGGHDRHRSSAPTAARRTSSRLDPGSGDAQDYVEDCQVCCQPWRVSVHYRDDGKRDRERDRTRRVRHPCPTSPAFITSPRSAATPRKTSTSTPGLLGMRLVKKSVNQDDPGHVPSVLRRRGRTSGHRPDVLPVQELGARPPRPRPWRRDRARDSEPAASTTGTTASRRAARTSRALRRGAASARSRSSIRTDSSSRSSRPRTSGCSAPGTRVLVPTDKQIIGLHAVRAWERELASTAAFLTGVLGFTDYGEEDGWHRYRRRRRRLGQAHRAARDARLACAARGASARCTTSRGASPMTTSN